MLCSRVFGRLHQFQGQDQHGMISMHGKLRANPLANNCLYAGDLLDPEAAKSPTNITKMTSGGQFDKRPQTYGHGRQLGRLHWQQQLSRRLSAELPLRLLVRSALLCLLYACKPPDLRLGNRTHPDLGSGGPICSCRINIEG